MAWSGFGQTHLVRKQAGVQESSGPVSGRMQPARYHFSIFRLGCVLPHTAWIIHTVQNQPGSDLVWADCVRFWSNGSGPEAKSVFVFVLFLTDVDVDASVVTSVMDGERSLLTLFSIAPCLQLPLL